MSRQALIGELKTAIEAVERGPVCKGGDGARRVMTLAGGVPQAAAGTLNEVWCDSPGNSGASLGFALMQAQELLTPRRGALVYLHLGGDGQEMGLPYGPGLAAFGLDPARLVVGRMQRIADLLWAIEEAAACQAVAAVIADIARHHKALDFTTSRRLAMRARAAGTAIFVVRYGREREASATHLRWHVAPAPSAPFAFDPRAPGAARLAVTLEKGAAHVPGRGGVDHWLVEWTKNGLAAADDGGAARRKVTALSRAFPGALGDRLPETA